SAQDEYDFSIKTSAVSLQRAPVLPQIAQLFPEMRSRGRPKGSNDIKKRKIKMLRDIGYFHASAYHSTPNAAPCTKISKKPRKEKMGSKSEDSKKPWIINMHAVDWSSWQEYII
ncbi:MAG: hypothetical protein ACKO96_47720, partial [Flammeovirgaceae bacterium]